MQPDGGYVQRRAAGDKQNEGSHQMMIARAEARAKSVAKGKKIRL
jgi:hypothetical protein